ncbi:MAG TPA: alpha-glucan family phosphorylase [Gemmatimonadaceae bacterium]|nr:alpha-glucan family phosphorylase [Gemmatimonadaceae bacterium]
MTLTMPASSPTPAPDAARPRVLPARIAGLPQLARNLAWSWNRDARALFREIDDTRWHQLRHNPLLLLQQVSDARLAELAETPAFLARYDRVMRWLAAERSDEHTWYARTYPELRDRPIAYFCAEFGFHDSVPIYSGGLGVLAGDHCKSASDLGLPLVGLGIFYRDGYFDQRIRPDGWQEDSPDTFALDSVPIEAVPGRDGAEHLTTVRTFGRDVHIRVWRMQVGRVPVYLLDSDLASNHPDDRPLLSKLYAGGPALRLRQEWLLGVGGVRVLEALGIAPAVWHANEGHAGFMLVERVRALCASGVTYEEAVRRVRATSVFTTHTPVPAGHDQFGVDQVAECMGPIWTEMGLTREQVLALGFHPEAGPTSFHMTALCIRLSRRVNGVSERHGAVSRTLCRPLWTGRAADTVPIGHVTNGVHLATWMANPMMQLLDEHLGTDWGTLRTPELWAQVLTLDDERLWGVHLRLKHVLMRLVREEARRSFARRSLEATQLVGAGTLLDPYALTIGFARRFATYKRANLLFRDLDRLKALVTNSARPVQIVFSGKAHPADTPGKQVLQEVYQWTRDPQFAGRIAFVEDYGMHLAHLLVQGVDLWLNLPRVPLEASGTSGMKAALNGVPQLSTVDGWWEEGYDGTNGWAIEPALDDDTGTRTAHRLYELLETQVVPAYYERNAEDLPLTWLRMMKHAMRVAGTHFTGRRMVEQYVRAYYAPSILGDALQDDPPTA